MSSEIKTNLQFEAKEILTVDGMVLVQPGPVKEVLTIDRVPIKGKKPNDIVKTREEKRVTKSVYRVGEVISVSENDKEYKVGDVVIYGVRDAIKLDILAQQDPDESCPVIVRKFNIVGTVNSTLDNIKKRLVEFKLPE